MTDKLIHLLNEEIKSFSIKNKALFRPLLEQIGDARIVLLGEATHGTQEFYQTRIQLSKYLIEEKGFHAIAFEADWPHVYPMHRYIQGVTNESTPLMALSEFKRFPQWMWRNATIPPFLDWLKKYNTQAEIKVGLYGLDLYSLNDSIQAVIEFLKSENPDLAKHAIKNYSCFDHVAVDPQLYAYLVHTKAKKSCVQAVTAQLLEMQQHVFNQIDQDNLEKKERHFYATQNARLVKNAEHYYRALFESREETWNIRDQHMGETLQNILSHIENSTQTPAKIIVWAHNSHIGDARATEMGSKGEINLGQIVREHFSQTSFHIGFSTYSGKVCAASEWDNPVEVKTIVPGISESYEALFHKLRYKDFILFLHQGKHVEHLLAVSRLQRAIGVIYRPDTERFSHYFFTKLPYQFDALIHFDLTSPLKPLDPNLH